MSENKLIGRRELIRLHPVLGEKPTRLNWLIRNRKIPCVKIGHNIFFNTKDVSDWIQKNTITPEK